MNKTRRAMVRKAHKHVSDAHDLIEIALEEEDECLSNMPENLESSQKYQALEENVDLLEEALDQLEAARDAVERITNQ